MIRGGHRSLYLYLALCTLVVAAIAFAALPRFQSAPALPRAPSPAAPPSASGAGRAPELPAAAGADRAEPAKGAPAPGQAFGLFRPEPTAANPLPQKGLFAPAEAGTSADGSSAKPLVGRPGGLFAAPGENR